ncbi:methyltransferase, partial [Bacillus altitudinis]|uniref:methyltransferase n=1 Tax=Bacillus altitudinis TaxID=293387 RepID=UPI0011AA1C7E
HTPLFSKKQLHYPSSLLIQPFQQPHFHPHLLHLPSRYPPIRLSLPNQITPPTIHIIHLNQTPLQLSNQNPNHNPIHNLPIYQTHFFSNLHSSPPFPSILTNPPIPPPNKLLHPIFQKTAH